MKTTFISTAAMATSRYDSMAKLQRQMSNLQVELSTGRHADIGLELGSQIGESISLRAEKTKLDGLLKTNALISNRFDLLQASMSEIGEIADAFIDSMIALRDNPQKADLAVAQAQNSLEELTAKMNVSYGGQYILAGINTDQPPMSEYATTPASAAKTSLDAAFFAEFGFTQSDPAVASISSTAMDTFLSGAFSNLFDATGWNADWTNASTDRQQQQIDTGQFMDIGPTAQERAFAELTSAFAMVADLGAENMNATTFSATLERAVETAATAQEKLNTLRSINGFSEERLARADKSIELKLNFMDQRLSALEDVDAYETSTQLSNVLNALEISYAVTGKIQNLSLVRYL